MDIIALAIIFAAALGLQVWIFGRFSFKNLEYRCEFSMDEAHEGDSLFLVETVYNKKLLPVPWLKVDIHSSRWLDFAGTCSVVTQDSRRVTSSFVLKGYQRVTRRWKLKCLKRGVFTTENVTLVSGDLLGFSSESVPVRVNASLMVYPEIVDLEEILVPASCLQSDHIVRRWIVDDPFIVSGVRQYLPTDPVNRIHWPASAKEGKLMVKKNEFTSQHNLTILLNMQSGLYEYIDVVNRERIEFAIKVAATLLDRALEIGAPVRLGTNGCMYDDVSHMIYTNEAADREHVGELFRILAKLAMKNVKDFEVFLDEKAMDIENSDVVIITSYLSKRIVEQIKLLEEGMNKVGVILLDKSFEEGMTYPDVDIYEVLWEHAEGRRDGGAA